MKPGEHKTVQSRVLGYAEAIGWTVVSREEAEQRRGFDPDVPPADRAKNRSLFFDDLIDAKLREFNPRYSLIFDPQNCRRLAGQRADWARWRLRDGAARLGLCAHRHHRPGVARK